MEKQESPPSSLTEMLDRISGAAEEKEQVSLDDIMDAVGRRSFGPLLLLAGVIISSPGIGDIPGVPTIFGIFVMIVAVQLLFGADHFWLPRWMLDRKVKDATIRKMTGSKWVRKPAEFIDHLVKERLQALTGKAATHVIAVICSITALAMPLTEFVPLSANGVGAGMVAFGISLIARDGVMALIGLAISLATWVLAGMALS